MMAWPMWLLAVFVLGLICACWAQYRKDRD